jgi:hypothetical protein
MLWENIWYLVKLWLNHRPINKIYSSNKASILSESRNLNNLSREVKN